MSIILLLYHFISMFYINFPLIMTFVIAFVIAFIYTLTNNDDNLKCLCTKIIKKD